MQRSIALFLCIAAQAATAQCVSTAATASTSSTPTTQASVASTAPAHTGVQVAQAQTARRGSPELIKTAAASTRDDAPPSVRETARTPEGQDHPRRGGTAMLLAALALMSGIALRRYGANGA